MKTIFTNIKYLAILFALILSVNTVDAQIGIDNETPNMHSSLDLGATDGGLLPNRLTTFERVNILQPNLGLAEKGMWVFDTNQNLYYFWDGGQWVVMSAGSMSGSGLQGQVTLWGMGNSLTGSDNFVWEENNIRLGIGTNSPEATTHINTTAGSSLKITSSSLSEVDEYIFGIERTINPVPGTHYLQMKVPFGSHTNFDFLNLKYGNQTVLKINGNGHLNASTIGAGTDDANARFNINDPNSDLLIDVKGGGTPSVLDYMINFERTAIPYSGINMLRMKLPQGSPDDTKFMEFERGNDKLIQIFGNGDIVLNKGADIIGTSNGLNSTDIELNGGDIKLFSGSLELHQVGKKLGEFVSAISGSWINMSNSSEIRTVYLNGSGGGGGALTLFNPSGTTTAVLTSTSTAVGGRMVLSNSSGNSRAVIEANPISTGGRITLTNESNTSTAILEANSVNTGGKLTLKSNDQSSEIILSSNHSNSGKSRISCDEIRLYGGADLAEYFDVVNDENDESLVVEPGTLVSIHPETPGKLETTCQAYDTRIVGVISGANGINSGMVMGQDNSIATGDYPIALTGRVYVKANDANGKIKPGDFLTSSSKPGYAMKVKNVKKATGAIIGKAMTSLEDNEGLVLVLISLQ